MSGILLRFRIAYLLAALTIPHFFVMWNNLCVPILNNVTKSDSHVLRIPQAEHISRKDSISQSWTLGRFSLRRCGSRIRANRKHSTPS